MVKTKINKLLNDWKYVKNVSRTTVNKSHTENEATDKFKREILISEHSPIREIVVKWRWENIKSWISVHFSRHKWECYISTQRSDRTGINRDESPQGALVNMDCTANAQQLIDMARKRLCHQSSDETRAYMEDLKAQLYEDGEHELSDSLVVNCIYRNGCSEFNNCGYHRELIKKDRRIVSIDIQTRYDAYNKIFWNDYED